MPVFLKRKPRGPGEPRKHFCLLIAYELKLGQKEVARRPGLDKSTIYRILGEKSKSPEVATVKKICDGLDITLGEFFSTPEFDRLEQEIQ